MSRRGRTSNASLKKVSSLLCWKAQAFSQDSASCASGGCSLSQVCAWNIGPASPGFLGLGPGNDQRVNDWSIGHLRALCKISSYLHRRTKDPPPIGTSGPRGGSLRIPGCEGRTPETLMMHHDAPSEGVLSMEGERCPCDCSVKTKRWGMLRYLKLDMNTACSLKRKVCSAWASSARLLQSRGWVGAPGWRAWARLRLIGSHLVSIASIMLIVVETGSAVGYRLDILYGV